MIGQISVNLWQLLNKSWQELIYRYILRSNVKINTLNQAQQPLIKELTHNVSGISPEFPHGVVPIESHFYISRPPIEDIIFSELTKVGGFIGIKAAPRMGKSSLILRIVEHVNSLGYQPVNLDFLEADRNIFTNIDRFLRWFCANISRKLGLESKLDFYWDAEIGSKASCSNYFQHYLLASLENPLVLILNELDLVICYPEIADDFILLLRSWYAQSKHSGVWDNFRLVWEYSQDCLGASKSSKSLFDVGLTVKLPPFTKEQVENLGLRYGCNFSDEDIDYLLNLVGGHPQLARLAFHHLVLRDGEKNLRELLDQAFLEGGIYEEYLRQYLLLLYQQPDLAMGLYEAVMAKNPIKLEPAIAYQLEALGLVNLECDRVYPACELFRLYFSKYLNPDFEKQKTVTLELETQKLRTLSNFDELTQLANRRYFQSYFQDEWLAASYADEPSALSLIICDIDYFKLYNKTYGNDAGDECLRQIANSIENVAKATSENYLVGRWGGEEFAVLLPVDMGVAISAADDICKKVKNLSIACDYPGIGGLPAPVLTVSVGVATAIPNQEIEPGVLLNMAENALNLAKRRGRDRVVLGT